MKMIEEQYVSFETAKLAKEKGFDIPCRRFFMDKNTSGVCRIFINCNAIVGEYSQPTQSLLARWLRETYKIIVTVPFNYNTKLFTYFIGNYEHPIIYAKLRFSKSAKEYSTYEEAFETGLQEALKQIESEEQK